MTNSHISRFLLVTTNKASDMRGRQRTLALIRKKHPMLKRCWLVSDSKETKGAYKMDKNSLILSSIKLLVLLPPKN